MSSVLFLAIAAVFIWLLFNAYATQEIMARGWGTRVRIYQRDREPSMYWFTCGLYLILATLSMVIGLWMVFKTIAQHTH